MRIFITSIVLLAIAGCDDGNGPSVAPELANKVITGRLEGVSTHTAWVWGDGVNHLCQEWSSPGWFYGSLNSLSSADVAILAAPDILELNDAESLQYTDQFLYAQAGNTIVFRGRNGFFGAWRIENLDPEGTLDGTWYFRSGGGGDFTADLVDAGAAALGTADDCTNVY